MNADKINSILNKIAAFERSKHLANDAKKLLIDSLKTQLAIETGQTSLDLTAKPAEPATPTPKKPS